MKKFIIVVVLGAIIGSTVLVSQREHKSKEALAKERLVELNFLMDEVANRDHTIAESEVLYDEWYAIYRKYPHWKEFSRERGNQ